MTERPRRFQEARRSPERYWLRAVCDDCPWKRQISSVLETVSQNIEPLRESALEHEVKFNHQVRIFTTKQYDRKTILQ